MDYYSVEHWQEHWDELLERVENGEIVGIIGEDGNKAVMVPADDEILKLYTELNNEAQ
jgi:antitoxin (DNA-binding transcriptional repressor) of toxin-antitoxin stability system|tara:strand:+ start:410 stop:583 length:174 start_codon:yes stop_codon:yes gene_type:complete